MNILVNIIIFEETPKHNFVSSPSVSQEEEEEQESEVIFITVPIRGHLGHILVILHLDDATMVGLILFLLQIHDTSERDNSSKSPVNR